MEVKDNETIGLKSIIVRYLLHWKLFLGVFLFSIIPAVLYLIYYPRTYKMMARIQIQEDKDLGGGSFGLGEAAGLMKSFGLGSVSGGVVNIDDELMTLTSNKMLRNMVLKLGVNVDYCEPFSLGYRLYDESPLKLIADSATNARLAEAVEFSVFVKNGKAEVSAESVNMKKKHFSFPSLPATIELPMGNFTLDFAPGKKDITSAKLDITYNPAGWVAEDLEKEFLIEGSSKTSNVIELSCTDYEKNRGTDMLDTLIAIYNKEAEAYKKGEARKSLVFLDGRIENIIAELAAVENQIEEYKSKNQLMDIEHDVQFYVEQMKELQTKLIELEAQSNVINMMDEFVKDPANKYNLVPVLLTAQEGEKGSALTSYNEVLLERARVIQNSSINNPLVGTLTEQADKLRGSVIETIGNAQKGMQRSIKDVKAKEQEIYSKMNNYPVAERQFVELKRRQEIIQGVYLILLQKREETALILGQTRDKARVIDPAYVKSKPVGPRKLFALIGMLVLTLVIPISYLFVRRQSSLLIQEYKKQSKDSK